MNELLIIFIDSLPYANGIQMPVAKRFPTQLKLTPGFGYSINIQAELFTGKTPDELGYFNEWTYAGTTSSFWKYRYLFRLLSPCAYLYPLDRIVHRIGNKIFSPIWNIPFRYLSWMKNQPDIFSSEFQTATLFSQVPDMFLIAHPSFRGPKRDERMLQATQAALKQHQRIFVGLMDLDGVTHSVGIGSAEYEAKLVSLNIQLSDLVEKFLERYPTGNVVIVSDHGMANVHGSIELNMEKQFGKPIQENYFYIQDSTMVRFWTFRQDKKAEIEQFLNQQTYGKIISAIERQKYQITSSMFGDIIFLLNEGLVFIPSFYGRKVPKAMHGYHPELESQKGVLLFNQHIPDELAPIEQTKDVYKFIKYICQN